MTPLTAEEKRLVAALRAEAARFSQTAQAMRALADEIELAGALSAALELERLSALLRPFHDSALPKAMLDCAEALAARHFGGVQ